MSRDESPILIELDEWKQLISSPNWKVFVGVLKRHRDYLQQRINLFIDADKSREAYGALKRMQDVDLLLKHCQERIKELQEQKRKGVK